MTVEHILSLQPALIEFVDRFAGCFGRSEPREHLSHYIRGQLSDLPRKSVEPIALFNNVRPRTLQEFLSTAHWQQAQMRDQAQKIVAHDHADPQAIGIVDDSGHRKKGDHIPGVQKQYCGNIGKVENCVVTVHLSYTSFDTSFRTMLDSEPYLCKVWADDRQRCRDAGIPDDVTYRPKHLMALAQLDRARSNGITFGYLTADIWYAEKPEFLRGLEERRQPYVVEIPRNLQGWLYRPGPQPQHAARPVEQLCRHSRPMVNQEWQRFHIKDTDKGPMVWEIKAVNHFWLQRAGVPHGPYWLVHARNVLHPEQEKYFLADMRLCPGATLETVLHVAFARWPIERCLQDKKSELGMSHFEVRTWQSLCRHLLITMVSHLFLARQTQRLRGEKSGHHFVPSPHRRQRLDRRLAPQPAGPPAPSGTRRGSFAKNASSQPTGPQKSPQNNSQKTPPPPYQPRPITQL